jgi:hypothetical protein
VGGIAFNVRLNSMLNGAYTSDEITAMMKTQPNYFKVGLNNGPKSILTDGYLVALKDTITPSTLYQKLQANDAYRGWTPQAPLLLYHNRQDDLVPFGNYSFAKSAWGLTHSNIQYKTVDTPLATLGSVHATSLIPAYIEAAKWIHNLAYP